MQMCHQGITRQTCRVVNTRHFCTENAHFHGNRKIILEIFCTKLVFFISNKQICNEELTQEARKGTLFTSATVLVSGVLQAPLAQNSLNNARKSI